MKYALFLAATLVVGTGHAERFSVINGSKLLQLCTAKDTTDCTSYITGISDALSFYQKEVPPDGSKGKLPTYVCVPTTVTGPQMRETVVTYLRQHKEHMDTQAVGVVLHALDGAYRCK